MTSGNEVRSAFLEYFAGHDHEVVASGPLVPRNDPTLMFTNAGMVPFKNVFTGAESRDCLRAATSQKCVRAGGKHNDLDNVGHTARHLTFFEMLGNFSFGEYFKELAIELAWNLLVKEYGVDPDRMLVTVYHDDDVAYDLWKKIAGLSQDRIIRIATSDNFWAMGATGPCGPCSEIFYDYGEHIPGGPPGSPDEDGDRFVEIWNLVFMQYEQVTEDERVDLPKPSIDTGMGLERITSLLNGSNDVYSIDLLRGLIMASAEASGVDPDGEHAVSHRVIADHLRSTSMLIADGVLPSNEGRGYVQRRIMRRAMRHAHMLGCKEPLMWRLVPALIAGMGQAYPELTRAQALITETLRHEEERFRRTLERGLNLLDDAVADMKVGADLPGDVAFKLYDTYGFPLDLTEDALKAQGRGVDRPGFDVCMEKQRADARAAWAGSGDAATEGIWFEIREAHGATEFLGYDTEIAEGEVVALVVDGKSVESAAEGAEVAVVVNQTPFYGESGGQMGDTGELLGAGPSKDGVRVEVKTTQKKLGDLHVHLGELSGGGLAVGDVLNLHIDGARRSALRANHSATHLLHEALRRTLGDHVTQKGSLVAPDRVRFDISHPKPVSAAELQHVENLVNELIQGNGEVVTALMTPDEAVEAGALALFGEKYGDEVRVVRMAGVGEEGAQAFSVELCGGTHVARAGDVGLFKIISEGAVAAGVRRIEALTGGAARARLGESETILHEIAASLKTSPADVPGRVATLVEERKRLERELAEARHQLVMGGGDGGGNGMEARDVNGVQLMAQVLDGVAPKELRGLIDAAKKQLGSGVVALVAVNDGRAALATGVTDDLTAKISAVDLVRVGAEALGGKGGGGRPDMAQAGGPDGDKAGDAIAAIEQILAEIG